MKMSSARSFFFMQVKSFTYLQKILPLKDDELVMS